MTEMSISLTQDLAYLMIWVKQIRTLLVNPRPKWIGTLLKHKFPDNEACFHKSTQKTRALTAKLLIRMRLRVRR